MSTTNGDGLPPIQDGEDFHEYMARIYRLQGPEGWGLGTNGNHVQSRLPGPIYRQFWAFLKAKGWSQTTGVQYAITQLLLKEHA